MRIGIHIGDITAGVIGSNIVRFDFYGPDVMVANAMESEGFSGEVNVSERAKKYIQEADPEIEFHINKFVEIKKKTADLSTWCYFAKAKA